MFAVTAARAQMLLCKFHEAAASHEERLTKILAQIANHCLLSLCTTCLISVEGD